MDEVGHGEAVQLMTSRSLTHYDLASATTGPVMSICLATVCLSNAGRIGEPSEGDAPVSTINLLAHIGVPLTEAACLEALSIATEARTAAVIDHKRDGKIVIGTGTDCIARILQESLYRVSYP
jgi:adenosylcobinamide amidohydrolase